MQIGFIGNIPPPVGGAEVFLRQFLGRFLRATRHAGTLVRWRKQRFFYFPETITRVYAPPGTVKRVGRFKAHYLLEALIPRRQQVVVSGLDEDFPADGEGVEGESGDAPVDDGEFALELGEDSLDADGRQGVTLGPDINWEELYAPEIRYLRFCYYDGRSWWDDWDIKSDNPLPQLVEVTIGYDIWPPVGANVGVDDRGVINDEFCTCRNQEPVDCVPLAADQLSTVIRLPQSDPLFRSRVNRETQAMLEESRPGGDEEGNEEAAP